MAFSFFDKWPPAIKISVIYLVFGLLWILFSDSLLGIWYENEASIQLLQTLKGWIFVFFTAGLIYFLVKYYFTNLQHARSLLKESEKHYKYLFRNNPQVMWVCEAETGRIMEANLAACKTYGFSQEEFVSKSIHDLVVNENGKTEARAAENNKIEQAFGINTNIRHGKSNGEIIDVDLRWHQMPQSESVKSFLVTANDVSGRNKALRQLEDRRRVLMESERQMSELIDSMPGMVYRCQNDMHWTMLFVGGNCFDLTGYHPEELVNNKMISFGDMIYYKDRDRIREDIQRAIKKHGSMILEYRIISSTGALKWVWEQARGIYDNEGNLLYIQGFITDITDQRSNEKALEYYSSFLNNIINNIPFPLFYKDLQGRFMGCNQHFSNYIGKEYDEIIGRTARELFANSADFYEAGDRELLATREQQKYETSILFPDGKIRNAVFYKSLFYDSDGEPEGIIGVYFDISERIQAEQTIKMQMGELERINKELERFTYTVSHDLRSPLVTIKGFLSMLREDALEGNKEEMENDIQRINSAADKMHFLLEDLLQLSRIGRVGNPFINFPMSGAAEEVLEYLSGIIREEHCRVIIQPDMPEVYGDRTRVMEVLQNLVENSIKFKHPERELIIEIGCRVITPVPVFYVKDNGIGIDKAYQKKIFDLFNKLNPKTSGTGIGLALVQRIVEFHGGAVWVESEGRGLGATFCFTLSNQ